MDDAAQPHESFEAAFDSLYRKAYHVAYCVLGEREGAEDAAQEALAKTYVHWSRASANPKGWVARVAANQAIGVVRRQRRRLRFLPAAEPTAVDVGSERVELQAALRSLSRRQREIVVLRYLVDLPEAEVAALLGCSVGTVKQHASRGLAGLRRELGDKAGEMAEEKTEEL